MGEYGVDGGWVDEVSVREGRVRKIISRDRGGWNGEDVVERA